MHISKDYGPSFSTVLVTMCGFLSKNNVCFFDLQAINDLLMLTSDNSEHQEHELECNEEIYYTAVVYTE